MRKRETEKERNRKRERHIQTYSQRDDVVKSNIDSVNENFTINYRNNNVQFCFFDHSHHMHALWRIYTRCSGSSNENNNNNNSRLYSVRSTVDS